MSRAYLETLADLPWSRFSGQAEPRPTGTASDGQQASQGTIDQYEQLVQIDAVKNQMSCLY